MDPQELEYALGKQIPLGSEKITFDTDYGRISIEGELGRKVVKAIRITLIQYQTKQQKEAKK